MSDEEKALERRASRILSETPHGLLCPVRSSTGFCNCDHKFRAVMAALASTHIPDVDAHLATLSPSDRDMREISTCDTWRYHHMNTMLAYWSSRGWCETYWDEDDDFDDRPKGWVSPKSGWRGVGDMCIPVDQINVTHWMPMPAPPSQTGKEG